MSSEKPPSSTQILPSQLRLTPHTTYSSFFLLRTQVTVNGQPAQVRCSSGGELTLNCYYPSLSLPLHSIQASLENVVKSYGVSRVGDVCCEQLPLFPVTFFSEYSLRKFLLHRNTAQQQVGSLFTNKLPTYVQLQLFLVIPDAVAKDAQVMEVTLENHSACMAIFKESEMFDYWSLFRAYRTGLSKTSVAVTIKDLISELHDDISWFQLGIYLDISPSELMKIKVDHREVDACKSEMLMTWLRQSSDVSWSAVVRALVEIRMRALAQKVALKYGVAIPSAVERREQLQFPVTRERVSSLQSQLLSRVQQLQQKLEADEQQLSEVTQFLEQAINVRGAATNKRLHARQQATSAHTRVKVLLERKNEVGRQLQLRQKELNFLEQLQGQLREKEEIEREAEELKEVLILKGAEVRQLQEQLREVEKKLEIAKYETGSTREEVQRLTVELAGKSARVEELEKAREMLKGIVESQRNIIETSLILSTAAANSKEALLTDKDQLSAVEEESIVRAGFDLKALKQSIAENDMEIARLSGKLQTMQAQLQQVTKCQSEEQEEDEFHKLMLETSKTRVEMGRAECNKKEGERQLEFMHQNMQLLQQPTEELKEKKLTASKPNPLVCTATGRGLRQAETGQPALFEVHVMDKTGDPCTKKQLVAAQLRSHVDGLVTLGSVEHRTPCTYEVTYQPITRGRHELDVTVNDVPVQGSPFLVHVNQAPHLLGQSVRVILGLNYPWMIAATSSGELVYSEDCKISFIRKSGQWIRSIDTTSVRSGIRKHRLNPKGVAVDDDGNIYVTGGWESHRLYKFKSDGKLVKSVGGEGTSTKQFNCPCGIALGKDNKLFVCDKDNHRIQVFNTNLKFINCFGKEGSGVGEFRYPYDLTIDPTGDVYVADHDNNRVQVFVQNGTFLRTFGKHGSGPGELSYPSSIHVDHSYAYVVGHGDHRVSVFYTSGEFITSFGRWGSGEGELSCPNGITIDQDGFLYFCDTLNNHIQVF